MRSCINQEYTSMKIDDIIADSIASEIGIANSHLRNHVNREGKILILDKDNKCEYCLIYLEH